MADWVVGKGNVGRDRVVGDCFLALERFLGLGVGLGLRTPQRQC